eukprot:s2892_g9.t1
MAPSAGKRADTLNPLLGSLAKDPKATEDFSKEVEELLSRVDTMATAGRLEEAVEQLLGLEKKTRQASDGISTSKLVCKICKLYFEAKAGLFWRGVDQAEGAHHHLAKAPWRP